MTGKIRANGEDIWVDQRGEGPDILLVAGLTDPVESWELQLAGLSDRYRVTAYDNRGTGRTPLPDGELTIPMMVDDAAEVMRALDISSAHVLGFSGGSAIAQELALAYPELVRSLVLVGTYGEFDAYGHAMADYWNWLVDAAPSGRALLEAFFLWVYTPRSHADGWVEQVIEDALAYPHPQSAEAFKAQLAAFREHSSLDRLHAITAPTLVLGGEVDLIFPPRHGRAVAGLIPGARFELMPGEAHQPFQELPEVFNARVDEFWQNVEASLAAVA